MEQESISVSFKPQGSEFLAYIPVYQFLAGDSDFERLLHRASKLYGDAINKMQTIIEEISELRLKREIIPAVKVWMLGDSIFNFVNDLNQLNMRPDGLYDDLTRDLQVKRKWLEKVIIFRRYLPDKKAIPPSLNWGKVEKGTRKAAEQLSKSYQENEHSA